VRPPCESALPPWTWRGARPRTARPTLRRAACHLRHVACARVRAQQLFAAHATDACPHARPS
jgi:hypothetical protein